MVDMRNVLAALCGFTVLATGYLSLSLLILHPPRADFATWFVMAVLFVLQSVLTLLVLFANGLAGLRNLAVLGGAGILVSGASMVHSTLNGAHFEGYALILGSVLVLQGLLTGVLLVPGLFQRVRPEF